MCEASLELVAVSGLLPTRAPVLDNSMSLDVHGFPAVGTDRRQGYSYSVIVLAHIELNAYVEPTQVFTLARVTRREPLSQ